jgi:hypothetical protein
LIARAAAGILPPFFPKGRSMKILRGFLAALATAVALPATAGQFSDLWWNPQESGWGVNVVQQLEIAFVTLFVYGPDGRPTWYVAPDARVVAYGAGGLPLFSGTLYRTRGPWHGGAFDPASVQVQQAGHLYLEALSKNRMRVHYSADNVEIVKEVVRQTWQPELLAANYAAQFVLRVSSPSGPPAGTSEYQADVLLHLDGEGFMRTDDHLGRRCEYRGPWEQAGKLIRFWGSFTCTAGDALSGSFEVSDLEVSGNGITGALRAWSATVHQLGRFAAVRR